MELYLKFVKFRKDVYKFIVLKVELKGAFMWGEVWLILKNTQKPEEKDRRK